MKTTHLVSMLKRPIYWAKLGWGVGLWSRVWVWVAAAWSCFFPSLAAASFSSFLLLAPLLTDDRHKFDRPPLWPWISLFPFSSLSFSASSLVEGSGAGFRFDDRRVAAGLTLPLLTRFCSGSLSSLYLSRSHCYDPPYAISRSYTVIDRSPLLSSDRAIIR